MFGNHRTRRLGMILSAVAITCVCGLVASSGWVQERPKCAGGVKAIGHLGIWETAAKFSIKVGREDENAVRVLRFLSEPEVGAIDQEGPSFGKVKEGDVIVAIGGHLITTEPAGRLFIDPPAGMPIELTLRRDGVEKKVSVVPTWICENDPRAFMSHLIKPVKFVERVPGHIEVLPEAQPEPPTPPPSSEPEPPEPPGPGFPHPWMGIGLTCRIEGNWYSKDLRFTEPPSVFRLEPESQAEKAGLKRGDVLTHIDGIPMDTLEGTDHFVNVQPGDTVEWTVLRDGKSRTVPMKAEPVPEWARYFERQREGITEPDPDALRYSGLLGETAIEVRGSAPVNVSVDYELGLVTIRTPDTTIRLKKRE